MERIELKYKIPIKMYDAILYELEPYVNMDKYCNEKSYFINNLYIDTFDFKSANERSASRKKLRLRQYENDRNKTFLELKEKSEGIVKKERELINFNTDLLLGNNDFDYPKNLRIKDFIKENKLEIGTHLCYNRIAFIDKDYNLRITFDSDIQVATKRTIIENNTIPGDVFSSYKTYHNLLEDDYVLMEIKTKTFIPFYMLNILTKYKIRSIGFSKYRRGYKYLAQTFKE